MTVTRMRRSVTVAVALGVATLAAGCGDAGDTPAAAADDAAAAPTAASAGTKLVSAEEAAALLQQPPAGLAVIDVRTPEEFDTGHLADAELIDFYGAEFAAQLDRLDRDTPYLVYCRSGNRSGQAVAAMAKLGFTDVTDVDGGVQAWSAAGLPLVQG
ncbi:MAG: rhodanese-like domain-containing protein [Acidimicrobiales bacterium]|nr:rhodanese-like domain-containing protein [Acidimicrobiales bacterium]